MKAELYKLQKKREAFLDEFDTTKDWNKKILLWWKLDLLEEEMKSLKHEVPLHSSNS